MIVDCDSCVVRGDACGDCVISVLLGAPPTGVAADGPERLALDALAQAGMVPRLRFVPLSSVLPDAGPVARPPRIAERSNSSDKRSQEQAS
jgi:hypothetical protein